MIEDPRFNPEKLTDLSPFEKLKVLNAGGGAVGSYCSEAVAKMGMEHITQDDIERYEQDNLSKSSGIIREEDAGRWKAEALAERSEAIMKKGGRANGIIGSIDNLGPMAFSGYDYVCAAPDNKAVREYINQQLKQLSPDKRPVYIVGGTDGEMAVSSIFTDLDSSCYRCSCEEHSFSSSRKRSSCADAHYCFTAGEGGILKPLPVSNLSSVKAAILMADDLRAHAVGKLNGNRRRAWNPDWWTPITSDEVLRRDDCPDCQKLKYPDEIHALEGNSLNTTLGSVLKQIESYLDSDDFYLAVHEHHFGEDGYFEFVHKDYCRCCGNYFDLYKHTRFIASEKDLLCDDCKSKGASPNADVGPLDADVFYGFAPGTTDTRILDSTLFQLGYTIGAYLRVTFYNGAENIYDDPRIRYLTFFMGDDVNIVKSNINLMEVQA